VKIHRNAILNKGLDSTPQRSHGQIRSVNVVNYIRDLAPTLHSEYPLFLGNYSLNVENDRKKAYGYFSRAADIDKSFALAYINMAVVDLNEKRITEARNNIAIAQKLSPDHPTPLRVLADIFRSEGNIEEAERLYKKAMTLNTKDASVLSSYGAFQFNQRANLDEAIRLTAKSISGLKPAAGNIYDLCTLIERTNSENKRERCKLMFEYSMERWRDDSSYQYQYSRYLSHIGDHINAKNYAIDLYDKNPARIYLVSWVSAKAFQDENFKIACDGFKFYLKYGRKQETKAWIKEQMAESIGLKSLKCEEGS